MKPAGSHVEDRLLELAYDELPPAELEAVKAHLKGCTACTDALDSIQGVRRAMSKLPLETPPDSGLDSLLAYAEQGARRAAAGPPPKPGWRRWWVPAFGLGSVLVIVGLVATRGSKVTDANLFGVPAPRPLTSPARVPVTATAPAEPAPVPAPPTSPAPLAQTGQDSWRGEPADDLGLRRVAQASKEKDEKARTQAPRVEVKAGVDASGAGDAAAHATPPEPRFLAENETRISNADPAGHAPASESLEQREVASPDTAAKKSVQSPLASANLAIAEQRWDAAIEYLRAAIQQTRDATEKDRLLDTLCGLEERLGRDCDPLERQYAGTPWATRRASARASRKTAIQPTELEKATPAAATPSH
jgi:hypothetical protein